MDARVRPMSTARVAVAAARHRLEERLWSTNRGARWLLRRDLHAVDRYRASQTRSALAAFESSTFSQNGEDGIIEHLTELMDIRRGVFAEVGAGDGRQNCTRQLAERGWEGVWIEGDPDLADAARSLSLDGRVGIVDSRVDEGNVVRLLRQAGTPTELDVLSIDIDSGNYQVTERVLQEFSPRLLVVEVNGEHRWDWVQTRRTNEEWDRSWNYGASLGAYSRLAGSCGYRLVGCDSVGVNAFFVRTDMVGPGIVVGDWRECYIPPNHRPGTVGHPRSSVDSPTMDSPVGEGDLLLVDLESAEVIGSSTRRQNDRVNIILTINNRSNALLGAVGDCPIHLTGRVFEVDGNEIGGQDPPRAMLAKVVPSGGRAPASIEIQLPSRVGEVIVVPTIVQEGVCWRPARMAEGVKVTVI